MRKIRIVADEGGPVCEPASAKCRQLGARRGQAVFDTGRCRWRGPIGPRRLGLSVLTLPAVCFARPQNPDIMAQEPVRALAHRWVACARGRSPRRGLGAEPSGVSHEGGGEEPPRPSSRSGAEARHRARHERVAVWALERRSSLAKPGPEPARASRCSEPGRQAMRRKPKSGASIMGGHRQARRVLPWLADAGVSEASPAGEAKGQRSERAV